MPIPHSYIQACVREWVVRNSLWRTILVLWECSSRTFVRLPGSVRVRSLATVSRLHRSAVHDEMSPQQLIGGHGPFACKKLARTVNVSSGRMLSSGTYKDIYGHSLTNVIDCYRSRDKLHRRNYCSSRDWCCVGSSCCDNSYQHFTSTIAVHRGTISRVLVTAATAADQSHKHHARVLAVAVIRWQILYGRC